MAIHILREDSETPNIQNIDDCRIMRYAVGGQDGIIKDYLNECGYTVTGSTFKVQSGELVLHGWQVEIDANGVEKTITSLSGTQYYICYLKVDLDNQIASIELSYGTTGYPDLPTSDDLTTTITGVAYLLLYKFTASSGTISNVSRVVKICEYLADYKVSNAGHADTADNATQATRATYASSDTSKGTIEQRLTNLGFRQGSVSLSVGSASQNNVFRQGNYVFGKITFSSPVQINQNQTLTIGTLPQYFKPKTSTKVGIITSQELSMTASASSSRTIKMTYTSNVYTDGMIQVSYYVESNTGTSAMNVIANYGYIKEIYFGFEAPAITA